MQNSSSAMVVHLLPWFQTCRRQNWKLFTIVRSQGSFGVNSSHDLYFLRHPSFQSQGDFNFFATEQFLFNITTATAFNVQTEMRLRPDASLTKLSKKQTKRIHKTPHLSEVTWSFLMKLFVLFINICKDTLFSSAQLFSTLRLKWRSEIFQFSWRSLDGFESLITWRIGFGRKSCGSYVCYGMFL